MTRPRISPALILLLAATSPGQEAPLPVEVSYNRHIRPILSDSCFRCHGHDASHRKSGRRLDTADGSSAFREGVRAIVPGQPERSELVARISSDDPKYRMPPPAAKKPALSPRQIALLQRWIEQGAVYEEHWSFIKPRNVALPAPRRGDWSRQPIDRFVLARLELAGLQPAAAADRRTLIRRVTLDLTGLLPTPAEVVAFVRDRRPNAFERVVDRLLASPHYGERMAVSWLDAARYGDTSAHHADGPRDMWAWRDWVVDAFNQNMPYDRFTVLQLAGDLLDNATEDQKVASAFNRNHCSSDEGGAFPEELRVGYVVDRVKTTSMVWLGLTMECSQCHDHKYDPITQKDYYRFYAFFNQTSDPGMQTRGGNQKPTVGILHEDKARRLPGAAARLAEIDQRMERRKTTAEPGFVEWLAQGPEPRDELPADMAAHYPLDETVADAVMEAAQLANADGGQVNGAVAFTEGKHASGVRFDGKTHVSLGDKCNFERTDRFSFGAWVYPERKRYGAPIARMEDRKKHRGYDLFVAAGAGVAMHLIHSWPGNAVKVTTKKKLKPKVWQHVFVTYDGSSRARGVKVYVDGEHWPAAVNTDNLRGTTRSKTPLYLGRRNRGSPFVGKVDDVRFYGRTLGPAGVALLAGRDPIGPVVATSIEKRSDKVLAPLRQLYLGNHDKEWAELQQEWSTQQLVIADLRKPRTTVMVMREMGKPRKTFMLHRGEYNQPTGEVLTPGVPSALPSFEGRERSRLGLARWLVDPEHPLTARVAINRLWYMVFGRGIVETVEDFGARGAFPSHPDLLDWLARDFVAHGWDVKRTLRQIVLSATYRQSARRMPAGQRRDPDNVLLGRGPRLRLAGEFIRDIALQASGLLVRKLGGPGVKPYQPPGLWNEVSLSKNVRFRQDRGAALYRRSLYTYWKRSAPPPSMRIFDAPTRERCTVRRQRTNTPLQALVTLNDPQFLESARSLAQRMLREGGATLERRLDFAYQLILSRAPRQVEVAVFRETLAPVLERYRADPAAAAKFLSVGEGKRDAKLDTVEHAAWMVIASMILNLDEALTKG